MLVSVHDRAGMAPIPVHNACAESCCPNTTSTIARSSLSALSRCAHASHSTAAFSPIMAAISHKSSISINPAISIDLQRQGWHGEVPQAVDHAATLLLMGAPVNDDGLHSLSMMDGGRAMQLYLVLVNRTYGQGSLSSLCCAGQQLVQNLCILKCWCMTSLQ